MTLRDLRTALCSPVSGVKRPGPSQSCQGLFNYGVEFNYGVNVFISLNYLVFYTEFG